MRIRDNPPLHLTYCLNVHPGETWDANFAAIRDKATAVRRQLEATAPFGLGLRLSHAAAGQLATGEALRHFQDYLATEAFYVFTMNGFPYGTFHGAAVKEQVYRPDWRTCERRDYTMRLGDILATLLPPDVAGSISTVPGSYAAWIRNADDLTRLTEMLADAALHMARLHDHNGRAITIALEPEPDCFLQTTAEAAAFCTGPLAKHGAAHLKRRHGLSADAAAGVLNRHIGVCLDTAHLAVRFEDPLEALSMLRRSGVRLAKIQLSAALRLRPTMEILAPLGAFLDGVYLHQVGVRTADGRERTYPDLPQALAAHTASARHDDEEWRVHVHVPLFHNGVNGLESTADMLRGDLVAALRQGACEHLEIETYTFDVLPDAWRDRELSASIADEYRWVLALLA